MQKLNEIRLFILDMDGTIYLGNRLFSYTKGFFDLLAQKGIDYLLFTNNASKNTGDYHFKLKNMSLDIPKKNILTSADVTARFIKTMRKGSSVYILGTPSLREVFENEGIMTVDDDPDIVVVSFDTTLTYEKLQKACTFIRNGAEYISTHCDINCPTEDGFIPDSGAICKAISASVGKEPRFFGKPFPETLEMIKDITGHRLDEMAIIGDRLYTDIKTGILSGILSILVLSGETKKEDLLTSDLKPDLVYADLDALASDLKENF